MTNERPNQKPMNTIDTPEAQQARVGIRAQLETTQKGTIKNSMKNIGRVLLHDPLFENAICHNLLTGRVDLIKPMPWFREGSALTDIDLDHILLHLDAEYGIQSEKMVRHTLSTIANRQRYHPVRDYLNTLQWDGTPRVRYALHHFLGAEVSDTNEEFLRVFMLGAVNRAFHPGCKFELMLCLTGDQGVGKSTFLRFLAIKDEWFSDDLRKLDDENVYRKLVGHWIIELAEMLAAANAKSIEEIKSFVSRQQETYKTPYAVYPADRPRQCVFAGTTNRYDFMPRDRSGNRRFLPIRVDASKAEVHILDDEAASRAYFDQMWAEIMTLYKSGQGKLTLSAESQKQQKAMIQEYMQEDTDAGIILDYMENYKGDKLCSKQLFAEALHRGFDQPKPWEIREICDIVNTAIDNGNLSGWQRFSNPRHFGQYGKQRGWERVGEEWKQAGGNGEKSEQMGFITLASNELDEEFPFREMPPSVSNGCRSVARNVANEKP